jgi:cytochrome b
MTTSNRVWDPLVRLFHWGLVVAFALSYISGEEESLLHIYTGYTVLGLISFRIIWGFIGTRHARFSDFIFGKKKLMGYLKSLTGPNPEHYQGHNPAGGWMVLALIISLFITTLSGLELYGVEEGSGPFASNSPQIHLISTASADDHSTRYDDEDEEENEDEEEFWEEIHEFSANFTILLIFIHISGVLVSSRLHRINLIKAMLTGYKEKF